MFNKNNLYTITFETHPIVDVEIKEQLNDVKVVLTDCIDAAIFNQDEELDDYDYRTSFINDCIDWEVFTGHFGDNLRWFGNDFKYLTNWDLDDEEKIILTFSKETTPKQINNVIYNLLMNINSQESCFDGVGKLDIEETQYLYQDNENLTQHL